MRVLTRVVWALLVPVLVAFATPFVWQVATGDSFMVVNGVSMEPTYVVGDVLVVQDPTGHDLEVGQPVVVEFVPGDRATQYVHRVHETTPEGATLKGDNNEIADPVTVTEEHVVGTPRAVLSGTVATAYLVSQSWGARVLVGLVVLALAFAPTGRRSAARRDTSRRPPQRSRATAEAS